MIEIQGKKYLTTKEASRTYSYSKSWFDRHRQNKVGPEWIKVGEKERGKIYYEKESIEKWFLKDLKKEE